VVNVPQDVLEWLGEQGLGEPVERQSVAGGCINNGARLRTSDGSSFFLKQNASAPADMFLREAEGLRALSMADGPLTPRPLLVGSDYLLLDDLAPAAKGADYWSTFGRQLAAVHARESDTFGFDHDNYLGSTPQPNPSSTDGFAFFRQHRLLFQAELAHRGGRLPDRDLGRVQRLADRLPELVPAQPASLLHGDLWSGNAISGPQGQPAWIDPAAHYGWAEAELGMTTLFGRFPEAFYRGYEEVRPLAAGWRQRLPIYNLYHLLNHLNLFGSSYLPQVQSVLSQFAV
jgi:protein-ribulosamine 3-kinase